MSGWRVSSRDRRAALSDLLIPLLAAIVVAVAVTFYIAGFAAGRKTAYREWLEALLDDEPADFDTMLVSILAQIQEENAA